MEKYIGNFVVQRVRKSRTVFCYKPPKKLRDAIDVKGETFTSLVEAQEYAEECTASYGLWKERQKVTRAVDEQSVDWLISLYFSSREFRENLKPNSQKFYRLVLETARNTVLEKSSKRFGRILFKNVSAGLADELYAHIKKNVSAHRAAHVVKALRRVWYVCGRHGHCSTEVNPFKKMGIKGLPTRTVRWTPQQIQDFVACADENGHRAVGTLVLLCYELCQRPGDMRKLRWEQLNSLQASFVQEKTGTPVKVPLLEDFQKRLEQTERSEEHPEVIICEVTGKPYDRRLYSKHAAEIKKLAGLPKELKISDLRRTGATEMAHSGCTDEEMRAVTGHKSRDVLGIYIVTTGNLAEKAQSKRVRKHYG